MSTDGTIDQTVDVATILERLRHSDPPRFPDEAIADARRHREEIIPALIECLETNVALAADGERDVDSPTLISLCLLIEFNASEAWPIVKKLVLLPDEQPFDVIGDGIHEIVPTAVALWGTDDIAQLTQWCLDTNVNEYCRSALAKGVCDAYARGLLSRETVLDFGKQLLEQAGAEDYTFRSLLIANLLDLHADELAEVIQDAFDRDLVDESFIDEDCVHSQFGEDKEASLQRYRTSMLPLDRITDRLQHWASFQPRPDFDEPIDLPAPVFENDPPLLPEYQATEPIKASPRIGRNDPCPCGSGKKFKKCCIHA